MTKIKNLRLMEGRLTDFFSDYQALFTTLTRSLTLNALLYLKGLMVCRRRNCQAMAEELPDADQQRLHHFISESKWSATGVMDAVTLNFYEQLQRMGLEDDTSLNIDESSFPKKGTKSAGVKRQYCGERGKVDNCQVGVFGALCAGSLVNLVQARLYKPEEECTKIDLATEIIEHVTGRLKVKVAWVCFDAFYGRDTALLATLIKKQIAFIADVPETMQVWTEAFQMRVPLKKAGSRGKACTLPRANRASLSVKEYAASLKSRDWKYLTIRHQSSGKKLKAWFHATEVFILNPLTGRRQKLQLLIRWDRDGKIKYSLCHQPGASLQQVAYRQCKRYFVEKAFREGKKELGLNEYQVTGEMSWDKHMAMVMLGQLFINEEKIHHYQQQLWFTTQDVIKVMRSALNHVARSLESLWQQILAKQPLHGIALKKLLFIRI
jgi:SRSO17 transposase